MLSIRANRGMAVLLFVSLACSLTPAAATAADNIIVKDKVGRKFVDRQVTALDREAVALVQSRLMKLATKTPQSIVLTSFGGMAEGMYFSIEIRLPLQYKVITKALTEADKLNGTQWDGDVYVHSVAIRSSALQYGYQYDPAAAQQWSPWRDKSNTTTGDYDNLSHIVWVDLVKLDGKWHGTGNNGELSIPVASNSGITSYFIIDYAAQKAELDARQAARPAPPPSTFPRIPSRNAAPSTQAPSTPAPTVQPAPAASVPTADRLIGTWNTTDDAGPQAAVIKITNLALGGGDVGSVRYTRSDCSFALQLLANNSPHFEFQERLKSPLKVLKCGAGAKLLFDLTSDTTIRATAVNPGTGKVLGAVSLVAASAAQPTTAAAAGACAVEVVRTHLSIKDASCEQLWRYHVMRKFLIPYVARQRAFIDTQAAGLAKVQADTKAVADIADLAVGLVSTYKSVFAVARPQDIKLLETVVAADDIVETVYGIPDSNECGPGVNEYIKIAIKAALVPPKTVEVIPTMTLKSGGCVVALFGEVTLVVPARNSLVLTQDLVTAYYKAGGDYTRAAEVLGVKATSLVSLVKAKAAASKYGKTEYNPLTTNLAVARLITIIDTAAAQCVSGAQCVPP